jgi:hypothetical protein
MDAAWRVDPALAVALLARYPSAAPARSHLEALVAANAHKPQVRPAFWAPACLAPARHTGAARAGGPCPPLRSADAAITTHPAHSPPCHTRQVQAIPGAAMLLATPAAVEADAPQLAALHAWAPAHAVEALQLLSGPAGHHVAARAYAMRCLRNTSAADVAFFLPQARAPRWWQWLWCCGCAGGAAALALGVAS